MHPTKLGSDSASRSTGFSKLNRPAHRCLNASGLRFKTHLAISSAKLEVRMDSLLRFLQSSRVMALNGLRMMPLSP